MTTETDAARTIMEVVSWAMKPVSKRQRELLALQDEADARELMRRRLEESSEASVDEWRRHNVAVMAMGALVRTGLFTDGHSVKKEALAIAAYDVAEAMMVERERRKAADVKEGEESERFKKLVDPINETVKRVDARAALDAAEARRERHALAVLTGYIAQGKPVPTEMLAARRLDAEIYGVADMLIAAKEDREERAHEVLRQRDHEQSHDRGES